MILAVMKAILPNAFITARISIDSIFTCTVQYTVWFVSFICKWTLSIRLTHDWCGRNVFMIWNFPNHWRKIAFGKRVKFNALYYFRQIRLIGCRCVILIRIRFIELARYCNIAVFPVICAWTDVSASAIEAVRPHRQDECYLLFFFLRPKGCRS